MQVFIIIATSFKRTSWLIERSLRSVYLQEIVNKQNIKVLVIDDNCDETEFSLIREKVSALRKSLKMDESEFSTRIFKNQRARFMSGTGAWNTGIYESFKVDSNSFISLLDDDDEYMPNHLADCISAADPSTTAVFQRLLWKNDDGNVKEFSLMLDQLQPVTFFIGNPGIQGSNMFFKTKFLVDIGGFDESLPNTTDRDLMIRFLGHIRRLNQTHRLNIKVLNSLGVIHHDHSKEKVNNNILLKHKGLDLFYRKHKWRFSEEAYRQSLNRAKTLFNYVPNSGK